VPTTECMPRVRVPIHPKLPVDVTFDAPHISSDGGALLLRQLDAKLGLVERLAAMIPDQRDPRRVVHPRVEQLRQRVYQIALGYEDCNDATTLRLDPVLNLACDRTISEDQGLSSQPSLSRLEHAPGARAIVLLQRELERMYVAQLPNDTDFVVLDVDTTDDPTHGQQPLSFFNAHYNNSIYFPVMVFDGEGRLVSARLRPGNAGNNRYALPILERMIRQIKARFPHATIVVRGDSSFCTPRMLACLEHLAVSLGEIHYLLGIQKNATLCERAANAMESAKAQHEATSREAVVFTEFDYAAKRWGGRERHVIAKLQHSALGANPRFIITSITGYTPSFIYEHCYCARGQAENHIKDFKRALSADRLSCTKYVANAFRLMLHAVAYRLMYALRETLAPLAPSLATVQFDTLRLRLLKVAALVSQSARRFVVALPRAFPLARLFRGVVVALSGAPPVAA